MRGLVPHVLQRPETGSVLQVGAGAIAEGSAEDLGEPPCWPWGIVRGRAGDPCLATTKAATGSARLNNVRLLWGESEKESPRSTPSLAQG